MEYMLIIFTVACVTQQSTPPGAMMWLGATILSRKYYANDAATTIYLARSACLPQWLCILPLFFFIFNYFLVVDLWAAMYTRHRSALGLTHPRSLGAAHLFHYYSLGGNTAMLSGLYDWHCHAFLVSFFLAAFVLFYFPRVEVITVSVSSNLSLAQLNRSEMTEDTFQTHIPTYIHTHCVQEKDTCTILLTMKLLFVNSCKTEHFKTISYGTAVCWQVMMTSLCAFHWRLDTAWTHDAKLQHQQLI